MRFLHNHSMLSILDGLSKVDDIVKRAKDCGHDAVAITDHASISSLPALLKSCKAHDIKPIIGCEFYLAETEEGVKGETRHHLTVWAKNWQGVESLMRQLSLANRQFYHRPRLTFKQALDFKECFIGTACCFGILSHDNYAEIYKSLADVYGQDIFFEIMPHTVIGKDGMTDLQKQVNERAYKLKQDCGGRVLLTNDSHYVNQDDHKTHSLLMAIQYRKTINDADSWGDGFYMRNQTDMVKAALSVGIPPNAIQEGLESCKHIADSVNIIKPHFPITIPSIYPNDNEAFAKIIMAGWNNKIKGKVDNTAIYAERMKYELSVIQKMDFTRYFLVVHDIISWARNNNIMVGCGRGSSSGSLICYLMDITQVDPVKHKLFFERFLNPERIEMPDIDIDFEDQRRQEVISYIAEKYGHDKTAFINTFSMLSIKSAFRDIARVYAIPQVVVNNISRQIEDTDSFNSVPDLISFKAQYPDVVGQATKLDGVIRQVGVNASGYIISDRPLEEVCVLERRKSGDRELFVTNWDKRESESFGLLKVDILGLSTLSVLSMARNLVYQRTGKLIELVDIPIDDPDVLQLFREGRTMGIFQFESPLVVDLVKTTDIKCFDDVMHTTALCRPGSLSSGQTGRYVKISQGEAKEYYPDERLKPILSNTKSVLVYQEQVISIFHELGGFTLSEADMMRKIIGKKLGADEFEKHRDHFITGCSANGISESVSNRLFTDMVEFSSYAFNMSHSCAYVYLSTQAAYFKVHYPREFFAASLTFASDDRVGLLVDDANANGLSILPPDINVSDRCYTIDNEGNIRYPLSAIKSVGNKAMDTIIETRHAGSFISLADFNSRVNSRACNKRVVESLVNAGAFESLGIVESDKEARSRYFTTLITGYTVLPSINFIAGYNTNDIVSNTEKVYTACSNLHGKTPMLPHITTDYSGIMVINTTTGRQKTITGGTHNTLFFDVLKEMGLKKDNVYYTAFQKCKSDIKTCKTTCYEYLKQEIISAAPKLIICFAVDAVLMFSKDKMAKVSGQIIYNAEFNCYVLFSYSPQYFANKGEGGEIEFKTNMTKLGTIIGAGK